ncbi:MAG: NifB/NifX family molybdenum-iron cluster-binding protein [Candidatus Freyarchaeota archaeon]
MAVASQGRGGLDDVVSPTFGRCPAFTIVDIENGKIKKVDIVPNQAASAMHGAGIAAVQTLANLGVKAIMAGRFGPNAYAVCNQSRIQMIEAQPGIKIRDAVQSFISGKLRSIPAPTAPMHIGMGFVPRQPGMGMSMGRGGGRGIGRMGGFGAGPSGFCVCPNCGYRLPHVAGTPCFRQTCPQCGGRMIREFRKYHRHL